ncbi:unnamed protein product [Caenorhabditis sp. 36 PRJEB53466]|nr:unnamed protein product [Caenorhabditis sp. 36 PRJEB53466]
MAMLFADMIFNGLSVMCYGSNMLLLLIYILQDTLLISSALVLFVSFTATFVFQLGLIHIVILQFLPTVIVSIAYIMLSIGYHYASLSTTWDDQSISIFRKFNMSERKNTQNLHVAIKINRKIPKSTVQSRLSEIEQLIKSHASIARNWKPLTPEEKENIPDSSNETPISELFERLVLGTWELKDGEKFENLDNFTANSTNIHVYKLNTDGPLSQSIGEEGDEENIVGSQLWQLPCIEFENIWENLIYESNLKNEVMSYVYALVRLSEKHVNTKIINVNRLILLTGPPGTGKTSLCKGLAQHLSIRLNDRFPHSVMVEVNSHSLFSKWFSESGKLVQKMFDQIDELAEDDKNMVFVLIDEVESLGMCRESSSSRSEPADAIRAVNALLTQIDRIRRRDNVLILCTSNLENTLDRALVDRADIVRNVGEPSVFALYAMLKACILELIRIGIVEDEPLPQDIMDIDGIPNESTNQLYRIAEEARGLSGRAISMLPTLVYSKSLEDNISLASCLTLFWEAVQERKNRSSSK